MLKVLLFRPFIAAFICMQ